MSGRGAGRVRGAPPARAFALAAVALLALPLVLMAPPAEAQSPGDPWWGPSSRTDPTAGWAVRVPLVVENRHPYPLERAIVGVDLDLHRLLSDAGWTSRARGSGDATLTGFTLDVDSLRVIEYQRGFSPGPRDGPGTLPLPHVYLPEPLDGPGRPGDPGNLDGSILFTLKERLSPGEKRFFYVYANPLEYGKREPATFPAEERAPLDALLWGSSGTLYYGWEPQQGNADHRIHVKALTTQTTTVEVFESDGGPFLPARNTPLTPNPLKLQNGGSGSLFIAGGKAFKLVASHPIAVQSHGVLDSDNSPSTTETYGYFPSTTGSFRGSAFDVYGFSVPSGGGVTDALVAIKASPGTVTVTVEGAGRSVTLTSASPVMPIQVNFAQWSRVTATGGEILLSMRSPYGPSQPAPLMQVPALTGGPSGTSFYANMPRDGGFLRVCPEAYTGVRVVSLDNPDLQVFPEGPRETAPPALLQPRAGCHVLPAGASTPSSRLEAYAIGAEARHPVPGAPVPFRLLQGAENRDDPTLERPASGHFGGPAGLDYAVSGRVVMFGYFNHTRVTIAEEMADGTTQNRTMSLSQDVFRPFESTGAGKTGRFRILASKPISVASGETVEHPYARVVPGLPPMPHATLGAAEFRGPLVELRNADKPGSASDFRNTGPGTPISFRLEALNRGRWTGGESLPDTLTIACAGPSGWTIDGCGREFRLASGEAERFEVRVTPPEDAVSTRGEFTVEARSATPGIAAKFLLIVYVEVRYGVGLWFDVENGRKTIDPIVGVDPGETHEYDVVVKNTGSTQDAFRFTAARPAEGWTQRLTLEGEDVRELTLGAGESRVLRFAVTAPNQETAPQNLVSITVESVSTDLASAKDIVNTATRIRPKINIKLELDPPTRVAEPDETAEFNLTVTNRGNDIFRILFREDNVLPQGWTSSLGLAEIDLGPGEPYTFPVRIAPPANAIEGDRATLKISAETDSGGGAARVPGDTVSAVVVVKRVHNLTTPPLPDAVADPGSTISYVLPLQNSGNGDDLVEILPDPAAAWRVRAVGDALLVPRNQSADLELEVVVPQGAPPGLHNLTVTLRLSREDVQSVVVPVDVRPLAKVDVKGLSRVDVAPGRAVALPLTVANVGNLPANFTLEAAAPKGWNVTFEPASLDLQPGESRPAKVVLNASAEVPDGDHFLALRGSVGGADAGGKPLTARVARPDLHVAGVQTSGKLAPGELVIVSATIGNRGGIEAQDVKVALVVDGATVDQVTLARVPVNQTQVATLNWLATKRGGDVQVVLDPAGEIVMASKGEKAAAVAFGTTLGVPAAGPLALLAALGAAALVLRRRIP